MRSCASEIQTSVADSPSYLSGTASRSTVAPSCAPISPTALERPPAPQSVIAWKSRCRAASSTKSVSVFSWIAWPICTEPPDWLSLALDNSTLENVAPWMPSRPVRPPATTTRSPGRTAASAECRGMMPTVPQKTSGLQV
jgi:hypothetical protein